MMRRSPFAWLPVLVMTGIVLAEPESPPVDQRQPHVLILGDSISIGYTPMVRDMLQGEAVVIRPMGNETNAENCQGTNYGVRNVDRWLKLGDGRWDVIHFNFGLHDLKRVDPETGVNSNDPTHPHQAPPDRYKAQLSEIATKLSQTGAALIFATTTPVPSGGVKPYRDVDDPVRYNQIARQIMTDRGITINDLYGFAQPRRKEIQRPVNVHFTQKGYEALAGEVVRHIRQALRRQNAGRQTDPSLSPLPRSVPDPPSNPASSAKVALGEQLFFDARLSGDNRMSCATCHVPEKAYADGLPRAKGADGKPLARNTPTVLNVAWHTGFFWDGRAASLEQQALIPIQSPVEMNQDLDELVRELNEVPDYVNRFQAAFGTPITRDGIAQALAAFQRTLVTRNSPLDRYLNGDETALTEKAIAGMELFTGEFDCVRCHHGPLLSDGNYYRIGIGFSDKGRGAVTGQRKDTYRFRTPSLRDVAETGPYMHNGSLATLYDVVEYYLRRVPPEGPEGLELDVEPLLGQSYSDIEAIVEFLRSLSGEPPALTQNPERL